jgi:hypothetical protein
LTLTSGCTGQLTLQLGQAFSCPFTVSGGTPSDGYYWGLTLNGQDAGLSGVLPPSITTPVSYSGGADTMETIEGEAEPSGTSTYTLTVTNDTPGAGDSRPSVSASFTLVVAESSASQ